MPPVAGCWATERGAEGAQACLRGCGPLQRPEAHLEGVDDGGARQRPVGDSAEETCWRFMPQGCHVTLLCFLQAMTTQPAAAESAATTLLYVRHGGQLSTEAPSMAVISNEEMGAAMALHAKTQYFHSDFAHTDYVGADPTNKSTVPGGTSWTSAPLSRPLRLHGRVRATLWIGTNVPATHFSVALSSRAPDGSEWSSLCGATGNTLYREGEQALPLPGQTMVAAGSNGGFSVSMPLELGQLTEAVGLPEGSLLRMDVACGAEAAASASERVDHRIWHSPKWASTVEVSVDGEPPLLSFTPHPKITQPAASM